MDVVVGYIFLYETNIRLARTDVAAQALWLACAVIYVSATLYGWKHGAFDQDVPHNEEVETPKQKNIWDADVSEAEESAWASLPPVYIDHATDSSHSSKDYEA